MIWLSLGLCFSLLVNGVLVWYCRRLTQQFLFFTENVADLETSLDSFDSHLRKVHELEAFYGDETLGGLMDHSRAIVDRIKVFYDGFSLEEAPEDYDDET
jgi:hypothetical protein